MNNFAIHLETENNYRKVEELTREAFWNVYKPGCDEHYFVHMMRSHDSFIPELAFVLEKDGKIIGNIMYTKAYLIDGNGVKKEISSFGPVCITPQYQRQGYGKLLIEHSLKRAADLGFEAVVIFGNPGNYVGCGFVSSKKLNICINDGVFPTALLAKELVPSALGGKAWRFIPSNVDECCNDISAVEAFDATFPKKEKAWQPSQEEFYIYSHSQVVR